MTFEEVLDRAIELLQRRGRMTYRALKRQFDLDDEFLEDLKVELIKGQRLAEDEGGEVLVWKGGEASAVRSRKRAKWDESSMLDSSELLSGSDRRTGPASAERRQLTVMMCDLVDSTSLAERLDPEVLREVVRAYQRACDQVIQRYEGHIAQYLGDGILVYFGFPRAHEDDSERAVRAGLEMIQALAHLNERLERKRGVRLAVRIGIHTGLVVIGRVGGQGREERLALGEAPNVASRIQDLADPDSVLISSITYRLVGKTFRFEDRGKYDLKGVSKPVQVYAVRQLEEELSRIETAPASGVSAFVGREAELALLEERWQRSRSGDGRVVLLSGEEGIGKSRLLDEVRARVLADGAEQIVFRCSSFRGNSTLFPVIDRLSRLFDLKREDSAEAKLKKLEQAASRFRFPVEESVPVLANLLSVPCEARYPEAVLSSERQRSKVQEVLVSLLLERAATSPVVTVWEDLHWADPSTLELLGVLIERSASVPLLSMLSYRPEFQPPWAGREHVSHVALNRFTRPEIETMVRQLAGGRALPAELVDQVVAKTDGVPLFVEEVTKLLLESGLVRKEHGSFVLDGPLPTLAVPTTLRDSLMARLDRMAKAREVAQLGATLGRAFSFELIEAVSSLESEVLRAELDRLVKAELLLERGTPPDSRYTFKHALIQDVAYESLLKSTRQRYHKRIARALEERFTDVVEREPELMAHHCSAAGLAERAVPFWQAAGERALGRSAHAEATHHLERGLELLQTLPRTAHGSEQEIALQVRLGATLAATKGYGAAEVERAYARARDLCEDTLDARQLFQSLYGLWRLHLLRAEYGIAREQGEKLLRLAVAEDDPAFLVTAHRAIGATMFYIGELEDARRHLEHDAHAQTVESSSAALILDVLDVADPRVTCAAYDAWTLWLLGFPDRAREISERAIRSAVDIGHPFSQAQAESFSTWLYQFLRDESAVAERTERAIRYAKQQGFPFWIGWCRVLAGWAAAACGGGGAAIDQMRSGLDTWRAKGSELGRAYFLALLAEALGWNDRVEEGLAALDEAQEIADRTHERWWEAERYRLRGELLLRSNGSHEAEARAWFDRAVEVAHGQGAKSLELRAGLSRARLERRVGGNGDALRHLHRVHSEFTEGFETRDLIEARQFLQP